MELFPEDKLKDIGVRYYDSVSDKAFVIDSWMKSFYAHSPFTTYLSQKEFRLRHLPIINRLMEKSVIRMAAEFDAPHVIIGYIVYEPKVLHYLYVKEAFRGFGIASRLFRGADLSEGARVTHLTDRGKKISERYRLIYSPYFNFNYEEKSHSRKLTRSPQHSSSQWADHPDL